MSMSSWTLSWRRPRWQYLGARFDRSTDFTPWLHCVHGIFDDDCTNSCSKFITLLSLLLLLGKNKILRRLTDKAEDRQGARRVFGIPAIPKPAPLVPPSSSSLCRCCAHWLAGLEVPIHGRHYPMMRCSVTNYGPIW